MAKARSAAQGKGIASVVGNAGVVVALLPLALLPQAVGGVHPETAVAFAVVELFALALWWGARLQQKRRLRVSFLVLPFVVGALLTLLQVVPLPQALLDWLQPEAASTRRFIAAGLPEAIAARVLPVTSLDPAATKAALLRLVGATALFIVIHDAVNESNAARVRLVWRMVVGAAALLILSGIAHAVFNVPGPWGQFSRSAGVIFAPIANANHLSKVLMGFSLLCLGRAFSVRGRVDAIVAGTVGVVCGVGVGLTLSRGGVLALIVALLALAAVLIRAKRSTATDDDSRGEQPSRFAMPALFVSAILVVIVGVVVVSDDRMIKELSTLEGDVTNIEKSKLALLPEALSLLSDHGGVGVGNNAFGVAFTAHAEPGALYTDELTFSHPENIVVAALVEHGVVGGGLLLVLALFVLRHLIFALTTARTAAAVPAVVGLVAGDMVDFALETGAGIAVMAVALGLCAGAAPSTSLRLRPPGAIAVAVVSIAAFAVVVVVHAGAAVADWQYRLDAAVKRAPLKERTQALYELVRARPFDGHATALLAVDARQRHQPREALAWANRTLSLWPSRGTAHLEAARALVAMGRLEQAMIHYRLAAGSNRDGRRALAEAFSRSPDVAMRERALPDTADARAALCNALMKERRFDDAAACADVLAARADATDSHALMATRILVDGGSDAQLAQRLAALPMPPDGEWAALAARGIARLQGDATALSTSTAWVDTAKNAKPLLLWRLRIQESSELDAARKTLEHLKRLATTAAERDQVDRQEVQLHQRAGDTGAQVVVLQRLLTRHPRDAQLLSQLGLAEHASGRTGAALSTYRRLRELAPTHPATATLERVLGLEKPGEPK